MRALTSGTLPRDPVEAICSPYMKKLLAELAEEADIVILDCPPVLAVADATILAAAADGVLLVVRAGHTERGPARRAVDALRQARTNLIGVVLNAVSDRGDAYYGYYGREGETSVRGLPRGKSNGLFSRR